MKFSTTFGVLPLLMSVVNGLVLPPALKPLTARIIVSPTPIVYVYDHCPFCVRVRLAFGFKNIKHEVRFLANDDGMFLHHNNCYCFIHVQLYVKINMKL